MIEVTKKEKETTSSVIRRFSRKMQQSSIIPKVKSLRYNVRVKSAFKKKQDALKRIAKNKVKDKLRKLGKIK
ncbi:MAG: hypothetical protein COU71_00065 [Parcubacteria group bacterium CG10_big_fil_rev_8_21_14_0_10_38_31]|nr:MAG: hypothetical protein COU71_00065 [Parcubacteria group bacterium CG10_big_fil_rev_8_21_14_0_10_38_31]